MDVPFLAINPSMAPARSGMDLNGVSESEVSANKFENELNEQSEDVEQVSQDESIAGSESTDESDASFSIQKPMDEEIAVEVDPNKGNLGEDLSRMILFLGSGSSVQQTQTEVKVEADTGIVAEAVDSSSQESKQIALNSGDLLKSIVGQQQGSSAASLSHDVKAEEQNKQLMIAGAKESIELSDSQEINESEDSLKGLEALFGSDETDSVKGLAKELNFKATSESEVVRPKTLKSMVDSLWVQQSVKGEVSTFAEPTNLQVSDSSPNIQVVKSFIDDLKPMLDQIRASKTGGEMVMSLRPNTLGQVRVEIQVEKNDVQVSLYAEKPQAREILQSQLNELKNQLSVVGLKLQETSVSSMSAQSSERQRDQGGNQRQPEWNSPKERNQQADFEDSTEEDRRSAA